MTPGMPIRVVVLSACMIGAFAYLTAVSRAESTPARAALNTFPTEIAGWTARRTPDIDPEVLAALGVDDHVNRYYGSADRLVHLYIGYYGSQREGQTIHSPMNCMPGAGWTPTASTPLALTLPGSASRSVTIQRVVIQKGIDKQLVLYWYASHGRVVSSEYWNKFFLVADAIRLNRTDGALVRVIAPVLEGSAETTADRAGADFVRAMFPILDRFLPS